MFASFKKVAQHCSICCLLRLPRSMLATHVAVCELEAIQLGRRSLGLARAHEGVSVASRAHGATCKRNQVF